METQAIYQKSSKADSSPCRLEWLVLSQVPLIRAALGDCMDLMASTADNYYDLSCVDPPYGIGAGSVNFINGSSKSEKLYYKLHDWDIKRPNIKYFDELRRVSKNQIIWGGNYFADLLGAFRCFVFWDKTIHGNSYADGEMAWTSFDGVARYFRKNIASVTSDGRIHPTQKPVALYRWLLKNYAKAGQRILDTHGGSFSSAVACHTEGYEMDIIEIDEEYYNAGIKRFKETTCQLKIF